MWCVWYDDSMVVVAFFGSFTDEERSRALAALADHECRFFSQPLTPESVPETAREAEVISVFVDSTINDEVMAHFPHLRGIATRSTGVDHIDLAAAASRGVVVTNVPSYGENTVAEHAFALLLALSKRVVEGYDQLRFRGEFDPTRLTGFDLRGKTLGVVGTGRIGQHAIRIGRGFGMHVVAYDVHPQPEVAASLGFTYAPTLDDLLHQSEVLTLHVPYLPSTHHLINRRTIRLLPRGAVLINTSRGAVVETEALFEAIVDGHVAGAGLDVVEEEGVMREELHLLAHGSVEGHNLQVALMNHKLIDLPNVIVTPHSAFNTREALARIWHTTLENLQALLEGRPVNVVTLPSHT